MSKIYQPRHNLVVNRSGVGNVATAYTDAFASDAFGRPESPGVLLLIKLTCGNPTNLTSFDIRVIGRQISQDSSDILGVLPAAGQPGILLPTFDAEGTSNPPTLATHLLAPAHPGAPRLRLGRVHLPAQGQRWRRPGRRRRAGAGRLLSTARTGGSRFAFTTTRARSGADGAPRIEEA